jgi:hypothetical protein
MKVFFNRLFSPAFLVGIVGITFGIVIFKTGGLGHPGGDAHFSLGQTQQDAIRNGQRRRYTILSLGSSSIYEVLVSGVSSSDWSLTTRLDAKLELPGGKEVEKALHPGDPDLYCMVQPDATGPATLVINLIGASAPVHYQVLVQRLPVTPGDFTAFGRFPDSTWREARPMRLGHAVFASSDEIEYLDNTQEGKNGLDWYTFTFPGPKPKLAMLTLTSSIGMCR